MATAERWRWLPGSLFGQLMLVLGAGLLLAHLLSAAINVAERDRLVSGTFGLQPAQRIADVVTLLDGLGESERERVVAIFNVVLSLHDQPRVPTAPAQGWRAGMFTARLRAALGDERPVRVEAREGFAGARQGHFRRAAWPHRKRPCTAWGRHDGAWPGRRHDGRWPAGAAHRGAVARRPLGALRD